MVCDHSGLRVWLVVTDSDAGRARVGGEGEPATVIFERTGVKPSNLIGVGWTIVHRQSAVLLALSKEEAIRMDNAGTVWYCGSSGEWSKETRTPLTLETLSIS